MSAANILVAIVLVLNAGATAAYAFGGKWNTAAYWLGATVIAGSLLWRELR